MNSRVRITILSAVSLLILLVAVMPARAQNSTTGAAAKAQAGAPAVARLIVVSLKDRRLALVENGQVKALYPVAIGKSATPSPTGTFAIVSRVINPTYYHHGEVIPPGPENPVGNRWMGLSASGYGIHGTNAPRSIGRAASHGCIRMRQHDLEMLFAQVKVGDTVQIFGRRDEETEAIFGRAAVPHSPSAPAPVLTAKSAPEASPLDHASASIAMAAAIPVGQ